MATLNDIINETRERTVKLRVEQCARIIAALWHAEKADPERFPPDRTQQITKALLGEDPE